MRWVLLVLAAASLLTASVGSAQMATKRVALIVANADYAGYKPLPNTTTDAELVRETLSRAGFTSIDVQANLDVAGFRTALGKFRVAAADADVALVYFAGHGIEALGRNWLIPTDASLRSEDDFAQQAVDVADVFAAMASARTRIAVLDACRNNPFSAQLQASGAATVGRGLGAPTGATGLAAPSRAGEAAQGVLLMYSAAPGAEADDGPPGQGSPFARAFQKHFAAPDTELRLAIGDVVRAVATETDNRQIPFSTASLSGAPIILLRGVDVPGPPAPTRPGAEFRDCPECPLMVVAPAGSFMMGSPETEKGRAEDEGPQRRVTFAGAFAIGKFEVTFAEYSACIAAGGCTVPNDGSRSPLDQGGENHPVVNVNWQDAVRYVAWLNRRVGGGSYGLPSEAMWEYAARARTSTPYFWGVNPDAGCAWGNVDDVRMAQDFGGTPSNNCDDGIGRERATVGKYRANAFGLHDTAGNVAEWVADCFVVGGPNATEDGKGIGYEGCPLRVVRGGNWGRDGRSAIRDGVPATGRYGDTGFRIARRL